MLKEKYKGICLIIGLLLSFPTVVKANVVWPSLVIVGGMYTWYIILAGLLIEFFFIRGFLKQSWLKSSLIAVVMNGISALLGWILIPVSGFLAVLLLAWLPTFDTWIWIFSYLLAVFCNALVEGCSVHWIFKVDFKDTFWWLILANALSVVLCMAVFGFTMNGF